LVLPPDYAQGRRYPLVIQSHGFLSQEFLSDGTFTTAFAARPLAAAGIVVLQVQDITSRDMTPAEAPLQLAGYEAAIDHLAEMRVIDPKRVGITGFSRTVYYTLYALTHRTSRFAVATIADGVFYGYIQYLMSGNYGSDNAQIGAPPFGTGLGTWLTESPGFNFDKVDAPLRIEVHDPVSLLSDWEAYAALHAQNKPVDLIVLPNASHVVVKPRERLESQQGSVEWFRFWLQGYEDPDQAKTEQYRRWEELCDMQVAQNPNQPAFCVRSKTH
jgi:dipeptidyl aminopeptidase/acylaminoacyl peptidase